MTAGWDLHLSVEFLMKERYKLGMSDPKSNAQTALLSAENISISRGMMPVLSGFDLEVKAGQAVVITGPNGSGKTTLLRGLAGLLPLDQGAIHIDGVNINDDRQHHHERMIYIGHKDGLSGALTTCENMTIWAASQGMTITDDDLNDAFESLGLATLMHAEARRLSEGQRRRSGMVRLALSQISQMRGQAHKKIWVLDEPLTAIDTEATLNLCRLIDRHTDHGGSVILSTHSPLDLARMRVLPLTPLPEIMAEIMPETIMEREDGGRG